MKADERKRIMQELILGPSKEKKFTSDEDSAWKNIYNEMLRREDLNYGDAFHGDPNAKKIEDSEDKTRGLIQQQKVDPFRGKGKKPFYKIK